MKVKKLEGQTLQRWGFDGRGPKSSIRSSKKQHQLHKQQKQAQATRKAATSSKPVVCFPLENGRFILSARDGARWSPPDGHKLSEVPGHLRRSRQFGTGRHRGKEGSPIGGSHEREVSRTKKLLAIVDTEPQAAVKKKSHCEQEIAEADADLARLREERPVPGEDSKTEVQQLRAQLAEIRDGHVRGSEEAAEFAPRLLKSEPLVVQKMFCPRQHRIWLVG